jgi:hypothetical protein
MTVAVGLMTRVIDEMSVHPVTVSVTVTVYTVVPAVVAVSVGLGTIVLLRFVEGDQLYLYIPDPAEAVGLPPIVTVEPTGKQKVWLGPALACTGVKTRTVLYAVSLQAP